MRDDGPIDHHQRVPFDSRPRRSCSFALLAVALLAAACGGAEERRTSVDRGRDSDAVETPSGDTPQPSADTFDEDAAGAEVEAFATLDPETQQALLAELSADVEQQLYAISGLEEAVGGPEASAASIAETAAWFASLGTTIDGLVERPLDQAQGFRPRGSGGSPSTDSGFGQGLFGGMLATGFLTSAAVNASNGGESGTRTADGITISSSPSLVETSSEVSSTDRLGVTTSLRTTTRVLPCPDADGAFEATAEIETDSTVQNGRTGKRIRLEVTVRGVVGDAAEILQTDSQVRTEMSDFRQSRGKYVDVTVGISNGQGVGATVNRFAGNVDDAFATDAAKLGTLIGLFAALKLQQAAEEAWKSGRCVELAPTVSAGPTGLSPGTTVTITAAPRSKIDGAPTGGTVTATLAAGASSVDPNGTKVRADASFTYVAPDARNETGSVGLEARSRRGIGRATIEFDTEQRGYTVTGGGDGAVLSGTIADIDAPFTLQTDFPGGSGTYSYSGGMSGTVTLTASGSGATASGDGTYTIVDNGDGTLTMTQNTNWCVTSPIASCAPTVDIGTLTPIG